VRLGLTALPNAAAAASGGLFTRGTGAGQINQTNNGRIDVDVVAIANNAITAAAIATNAIDADALAADAIAEINATVDTALADYDGPTHGELVSEINAVQSDIAALNNLSAAEVNAEVVDALATDTYAEPTGVPPATATLAQKLGTLYMMSRNRVDVTASKKTFYDDGNAAEFEKDLSDDGTIYSESEANAV